MGVENPEKETLYVPFRVTRGGRYRPVGEELTASLDQANLAIREKRARGYFVCSGIVTEPPPITKESLVSELGLGIRAYTALAIQLHSETVQDVIDEFGRMSADGSKPYGLGKKTLYEIYRCFRRYNIELPKIKL